MHPTLATAARQYLPHVHPTAFSISTHTPLEAHLAPEGGIETILPFGEDWLAFAPLLEAINWKADLLFLNLMPCRSGASPDVASPTATFWSAARRLTDKGEMVALVPTDIVPSLRTYPDARRIWLTLTLGPESLIFYATTGWTNFPPVYDLSCVDLKRLPLRARMRLGFTVTHEMDCHGDSITGWDAAITEAKARLKPNRSPNLFLDSDGALKVFLTQYQRRIVHPRFPLSLHREKFAGRTVQHVWVNARDRRALLETVADQRITVSADVAAAIERTRLDFAKARAPYLSLAPHQRLAWLDEHDSLLCTKSLAPHFVAGRRYPIESRVLVCERDDSRPNITGDMEEVTLTTRELAVRVWAYPTSSNPGGPGASIDFTEARGARPKVNQKLVHYPVHGVTYIAADPLAHTQPAERHPLATLVDHFEIPEVPDVAALFPERHAKALATLSILEKQIQQNDPAFEYRQFQRHDLARFVCHPGGILGWDPGAGKTVALYSLAYLYEARLSLIVAPEGLHAQLIDEAQKKFGITVRQVLSHTDVEKDEFLTQELLNLRNGNPQSAISNPQSPVFYLTSYTALGFNNADEWKDEIDPETSAILVSPRLRKARLSIPGFRENLHQENIGVRSPHHGIRCVLRPSLATILTDLFDLVVCDEGVRVKGDKSCIGIGVRRMQSKYRAILTGTPIKNRLEDIFHLASWTCLAPGNTPLPPGSHTALSVRFPYAPADFAKADFGFEFMVSELNHTRAERYAAEHKGKRKTFRSRLPKVTNVHNLWRVLAPAVIRRRKSELGCDLVPKVIHPVRVLPGLAQRRAYAWHVSHPPKWTATGTRMKPIARVLTQLNNLRMAALCPDSADLRGDLENPLAPYRSHTDHSPLQAATLRLIEQFLSKGEQCVVLAPFQHFGQQLFVRLIEAGVTTVLLDGNTRAKDRGRLAAEFKRRRFAVLIGTDVSMSEGHSFDQCPNLIRPGLHWAYDVNAQAEDRVQRLTSKLPAHIWCLITQGTIAERLFSLYQEKSEGAALALGKTVDPMAEDSQRDEATVGQLLSEAIRNFDPNAPSIPEDDIEAQWPELRRKLGYAEQRFREFDPEVAEADKRRRATGEPSTETAEFKQPPTGIANAITSLPDHTLAAAAGANDPAALAYLRALLLDFSAQHPAITDWRQLWQRFSATATVSRNTPGKPLESVT